VVTQISQIGFLLLIAALIAILTRRLRMPYTVGLVLGGMGLAIMPLHLELMLTKDLIYSLFLPPLVFEAALYIHWRELRQDLPVVGLLATLGVLLAAALTATGMHFLVHWGWGAAAVFGALIAATDPVSVIATFREAGVRGRLRLLLEAESLLNDGTAAVLFVAALGLATGGAGDGLQLLASLLLSIGGGALCGAALGLAFTTLSAYGSFLLAEHFHLSGVLAALTAGLVTGNYGAPGYITASGRETVRSFWEYVAFLANSLVFLLIGAYEAQQHFGAIGLAVLAAIVLVTLGRALAIYPLCALFNRSALRVAGPHQHVLFWGGLRGALALALALGLPADFPQRDAVVTVTFGVVAFSIFAQGLTMTPLLRRLRQL
jgi:CPA1 family monovalent cation:H+ antiporter